MGLVFEVIKKHTGAVVVAKRWQCTCRTPLGLPAESLLAPTKKEIELAWAKHLTDRILKALKAGDMLKDDVELGFQCPQDTPHAK